MKTSIVRAVSLFALFTLLSTQMTNNGAHNAAGAASQPAPCRSFVETGKSVCNRFLAYWEKNGGLPQQGFPISGEFREQSEVDGKLYTVQYFERAVFESHPGNQPPYDVLLSLLGSFEYTRRYGAKGASDQKVSTANPRLFVQTGKSIGGRFRAYWEKNGGLAQQGYPTSEEFQEKSNLDGKTYTVQYFERAVFEYHPENKPPYDVLLSQLGALRMKAKYAGREPGDVYASLRARPLRLPVLAPGQSCPRASGRIVSPSFGPALGHGPVYPVGLGTEGIYDLAGAQEEGGWFYAKVLWVGSPDFRSTRGAVLVRGRQLHGAGELRFERGPDPANELRLHGDDRTPDAAGWIDWPSYTRLRGPGCYAYQVDTSDRSLVIPFEAK